ncbi:MAG TPA: hypothetical protein VND19_24460 [Acetobacteraceae bacterium]|nr:hypothetical protein [Acetobacteraceae bacterium]
MVQGGGGSSGREIRELGRRLAAAPDAEVARAVAVVDQLPRRGAADQLIDPLRPRLARLRLPRPLRFTRLLFLPLEPLIVPPPRWQPRLPNIPRSALAPLAATVRAGLGTEAEAIDAMIHGSFSLHAEAVMGAGNLLWPRAAALLSAAPPPVGWAETGLNMAMYTTLARRVGAVLAQAPLLRELIAEADAGIASPRLAPVQAMLGDVGARCPDALTMLVTLLLANLPQLAGLLARIAPELSAQTAAALRQAGQEATEALLAGIEAGGGMATAITGSDLADAAQEVRRTISLLRQLAERTDIPQMRARVQAIHERLDGGCRQRFAQAMASEFLPLLRQPPAGSDGAAARALEATARHLRELESEARLIGGGDAYDAQLRDAAAAVRAGGATMSLPARVRLVEILAGTEAALALLETSPA